MKKISLLKLFLIFIKIGAILLGGGYVILPILINEFVEQRKLIEHEDLINYFALSQSLPGIIAANISMFVGYKLHGKLGAITAMFGVIIIPFCCIVLLSSLINCFTDNNLIQSAFWGIEIAVITLIILTTKEMWQKSPKNLYFYTIFISALITLTLIKLSPIQTILVFTTLGVAYKLLATPKEAR